MKVGNPTFQAIEQCFPAVVAPNSPRCAAKFSKLIKI